MNRALFALLAGAALLALASAAGCQKRTMAETNSAAANSPLRKDPTKVPIPAADESKDQAELLEPPKLALAALHDEFMKQGPKLGYEYVTGMDALKGDKIPGGQMVIYNLILQYYQINGKGGDVNDPVYRATTIENYLKDPKFPVQSLLENPQQEQAEKKAEEAKESGAQWQEALSVALSPAGDWHSFREVREGKDVNENVVKHDDKYYKNLNIQLDPDPNALFNGMAALQELRDGKLEESYKQPFRFNKETGELTMFSDEGNPLMVLILRQMSSEQNVLYVKKQEDFVYTVYERIGAAADSNVQVESVHGGKGGAQGGGAHAGGAKGGK